MFHRLDDAKDRSYFHYPQYYLLIMKYQYANLIFAYDFIFLSGSIRFTSSVDPEKKNAGRRELLNTFFHAHIICSARLSNILNCKRNTKISYFWTVWIFNTYSSRILIHI